MKESDLEEELSATWDRPPGLFGFLSAVNHKQIGIRYIVTAWSFFILAGLIALLMRLQLAWPELQIVNPDLYNQLFTMHGTTMMFLFAVPMMEGIGIYLVPLMIGTRDMAFPRLNAFGYWVYLIAGLTLYIAFFAGVAPDAGWFNYVPLSGPEYSPSVRVDFWATMITFIEVAALVAAVELIVTIFKQRAPGMSLNRVPLFVWAILVMSFMIVFAMPPLMVASVMLALDRTVDAHFFNVAQGGDPILWQHIFWFFGHPEVYIIFIPALGIVSAILPTFARRPMYGYTALALSFVAIGIISFGLWVHHMFASGLPILGMSFFTAASMMVAIPSTVQIFCWIATVWNSRLVVRTPFLYLVGFVLIFFAGGITGVMIGSVPFDLQVHDTFFIVAHFHYVLIGGAVFPLLAGVYFWFPKLSGRLLNEKAGWWSFAFTFIGFNLAFFPQHQLGFMGMTRRIYTYVAETGWGPLNLLSSVGALVLGLGLVITFVNVIVSLRRGKNAGSDPWRADTLEWHAASPPPPYNFEHVPFVRGRSPLWEEGGVKDGTLPSLESEEEAGRRGGSADDLHPREMVELRRDRREALTSTLLDAEPESILVYPGPTIWPLITALFISVAFIGVIHDPWWVPVGALLSFAGFVFWLRPREDSTIDRKGPPGRRGSSSGGAQSGGARTDDAGGAGRDARDPDDDGPREGSAA